MRFACKSACKLCLQIVSERTCFKFFVSGRDNAIWNIDPICDRYGRKMEGNGQIRVGYGSFPGDPDSFGEGCKMGAFWPFALGSNQRKELLESSAKMRRRIARGFCMQTEWIPSCVISCILYALSASGLDADFYT